MFPGARSTPENSLDVVFTNLNPVSPCLAEERDIKSDTRHLSTVIENPVALHNYNSTSYE